MLFRKKLIFGYVVKQKLCVVRIDLKRIFNDKFKFIYTL
jgi:hypothetical protein